MLEFTKHGLSGNNLKVIHGLDAVLIGKRITNHVIDCMVNEPAKRPFILGLPTGVTPMPFLSAFVEAATSLPPEKKSIIRDRLHVVAMDDFIDPISKDNIDPKIPHSVPGFVIENFFGPLATVLGTSMDATRILYPHAGQVGQLRDEIIKLGGMDLQIMATDPYEGYVAQNFPGEPFEKTEAAKAAPFSKGFLRHHPWASAYHGVTFGLSDFAEMVSANPSGIFELVVTGSAKKSTLERFLAAGKFAPEIPLTFLWDQCDRTTVYTDQVLSNDSQ